MLICHARQVRFGPVSDLWKQNPNMKKPPKSKSGKPRPKFDADTIITNKIIDALDKGVIPWRRPWHGYDMIPKNLLTGQEYTGTNIWLLMATCFDNPWWITFNQARELGGTVRKGEHGSTIFRWLVKEVERKNETEEVVADDAKPGETRKLFVPKVYTVFNVRQCDGLSVPSLPTEAEFNPILAAEQVIAGYKNRPRIENGLGRAVYCPATDVIEIPNPTTFETPEKYYLTLFHEAVHSSGAPSRLNRPIQNRFGTAAYAKEEFIAELGAAVLCSRCGISTDQTDEECIAYCQSWKGKIESDKTLFRTVSKQAIEAARYITGAMAESRNV